jgi:hypothetical protein
VDTFTTVWNRLLLRAPGVGQFLAEDLVRDSFQQLAERRQWSWQLRHSAFLPTSNSNLTDTVSVVSSLPVVISSGSLFSPALVGQQFRLGGPQSTYPTYTIAQYISPNSIILDSPWIGPSLIKQQYIVFLCYFPVPADFQSFYSLINPTMNMRLWPNVTQAQLDMCDAQRVVSGPSFCAAFYDYTANYQGTVGPVQPVYSVGSAPVSTTSYGYSYPLPSVYSIRITTSGSPGDGNLAFAWKQDNGTYSLPIAVFDNSALDLSNGVQLYFPQFPYVAGDTFIVSCQSQTSSGVPRYELWPRPINTPYVYPYQYIAKLPALTNEQPQLPPFVAQRGDVLLELALTKCAQFPGTDTTRNTYYDLNLARMHMITSDRMVNELELKDDNTAIKDLSYANGLWAPTPWLDGSYLQSHAWPYASWGQ